VPLGAGRRRCSRRVFPGGGGTGAEGTVEG
jgi:hypothetical protein